MNKHTNTQRKPNRQPTCKRAACRLASHKRASIKQAAYKQSTDKQPAKIHRALSGNKNNAANKIVTYSLVMAAGLMGLGLFFSRLLNKHDDTYLRFRTMFGKTRIYQVEDDDGSPVRLLEVGGIVQSGCYVDNRYADLVFEYLKAYDLMFEAKRSINRVCVLGCGAYDYPKHLLVHHKPVEIDAIEIDPFITQLARCYFYLDQVLDENPEEANRLHIINKDALEYLTHSPRSFDAIVNDTYDAGKVPKHLCGEDFVQALKARLNPEGIYLTNIVSPLEGRRSKFLKEQIMLLEAHFAHVYCFPCSKNTSREPDNVIVCASDKALPQDLIRRHL